MRIVGDYEQDGYALLGGLIAPEICRAFLHQLHRDITAGGSISRLNQGSNLLARDTPELYGFHYPPMLAFLWGLTPIMCEITKRDLLPTYDYFRLYREGDICRVHSDRPSCEHSLSLTLDYSDGVSWPLDIGGDRTPEPQAQVDPDFGAKNYKAIAMEPGDAVLYQGVHYRHGRVAPNPNAWSAHLFLHWVDRGGPYAEYAFDSNEAMTRSVNFRFD